MQDGPLSTASSVSLQVLWTQWQAIRDYKRGETPLGVPQQTQTEEEEDDDDGDDDMTEEDEVLHQPWPEASFLELYNILHTALLEHFIFGRCTQKQVCGSCLC